MDQNLTFITTVFGLLSIVLAYIAYRFGDKKAVRKIINIFEEAFKVLIALWIYSWMA